MYIEIGMEGPEAFGNAYNSNYSWGAMATLCGGDIITKGVIATAGPVNPEFVLEKDPEIIMIMDSYWPKKPTSMRLGFETDEAHSQQLLKAFTQREGWNNLKAVKNHQVHR